MLESFYNFLIEHDKIIGVVGDAATAITIIFLTLEHIFSRRAHRYNCEWQEKNKAAELALYYKDEIMPRISYINEALDGMKLSDGFGRVKKSEMRRFTREELFSLVPNTIESDIREKFMNSADNMVIIYANRHEDPKPIRAFLEAKDRVKIAETKEEKERAQAAVEQVIRTIFRKFHNEIGDLLNNLEYFSMHFTTDVADSTIVYPSLHQTYLEIVERLYWAIALQNKSSKDKFYMHCIALYKQWSEMDTENAEAADRVCTSKGWRIKR